MAFGGTATGSADFAFTGIASNTPVASISAVNAAVGSRYGLALNAANSSIQSLLNSTLTLGGNTTGNIALNPGNNGVVDINGTLQVMGGTVSDIDTFNRKQSYHWGN